VFVIVPLIRAGSVSVF